MEYETKGYYMLNHLIFCSSRLTNNIEQRFCLSDSVFIE